MVHARPGSYLIKAAIRITWFIPEKKQKYTYIYIILNITSINHQHQARLHCTPPPPTSQVTGQRRRKALTLAVYLSPSHCHIRVVSNAQENVHNLDKKVNIMDIVNMTFAFAKSHV